ncbi:hypothetical protein E2562_027277 [Oryza meyeriana var. granulata]|uniref:Uncharacterized protein n=1 Tax=Oryza meyeriana var. granulata TaxID=110450 RepID=A0A6G1C967_9ORYZ|nr:hypothetical protein E2562_027277 [Oryza meyeriana var. granulata]
MTAGDRDAEAARERKGEGDDGGRGGIRVSRGRMREERERSMASMAVWQPWPFTAAERRRWGSKGEGRGGMRSPDSGGRNCLCLLPRWSEYAAACSQQHSRKPRTGRRLERAKAEAIENGERQRERERGEGEAT